MTRMQLRFDGLDVNLGAGKFSGAFDIPDEELEAMRFGDNVTFVVTAQITKVGYDENKTGDIRRLNNFEVTGASILDPKLATQVLNSLGMNAANDASEIPGQTNFLDDTDAGTLHVGPELDEDDQVALRVFNG